MLVGVTVIPGYPHFWQLGNIPLKISPSEGGLPIFYKNSLLSMFYPLFALFFDLFWTCSALLRRPKYLKIYRTGPKMGLRSPKGEKKC